MNRNHLSISLFCILAYYVANSVANDAIIDGSPVGVDQFLYIVSVQLDDKPICGGGIINHLHIITAAHCVVSQYNNFRGEHMTIIAGTNNLTNHENPRMVRRDVGKIYLPTKFNPMSDNPIADIAILKLRHPLDFHKNEHLTVLRVPNSDSEHYKVASIAGFGNDRTNTHGATGGPTDQHLRWAGADILDRSQCRVRPHGYPITEKQLCVKVRENRSTRPSVCIGDVGSPLVINSAVIGLLSRVPVGCVKNPAIYTRVYAYRNFIRQALNNITRDDIRTLVLHE